MKRIIVALAMVAASVFVASPALADQAATDTTISQAGEGNEVPCVAADAYDETVVDEVAYDETVIDVEGQAAIPGTDAVYGPTQYQFEHAPNGVYMIRWETDPNWNAESNPNSTGWRATGETQQELITPAVPGTPAVEEVSHIVHHDAVTHVVHHDAVVCDGEGDVIAVPAALPITDACGTGNAAWVYSGDTSNDFSWDLTNAGALSAIAHEGFVFDNGQTVIEFGMAPETNTQACPVIDHGKKVFVCKYVGKPGVDERLQTGNNPISVSVNAIPGPGPVELGYEFADAQGRSLVIAFDTGQKPEPDVSSCPGARISANAVADVVTSQNCDGGAVPHTTVADGVTYKFARGDGISGPWEITATAKDGFTLVGKTVFTGNSGNPDNCDKVNPVSDDTDVPNAAAEHRCPADGGSPLGLLAIGGLLVAAGAMLIGRRRTI